MRTINVTELKAKISASFLHDILADGDSMEITSRGNVIGILQPAKMPDRVFGVIPDLVMQPNFDDPLEENMIL